MKKVALGIEINNNAGRGVLGGILKYISGHGQWHIRLLTYPETLSAAAIRQARAGGINGIIVNHLGDEATARELKSAPIPVSFVDIDLPMIRSRRAKTAFVGNRNDIVGALGARKFLSLGKFRSFVFLAHPDRHVWSEERKSGYCTELKNRTGTASLPWLSPAASARRTASPTSSSSDSECHPVPSRGNHERPIATVRTRSPRERPRATA